MRGILAEEEKKTKIGKILLRFKYYELADPKVRERLEKQIIKQFGDEGHSMIRLMEDSNLLPEIINNNSN